MALTKPPALPIARYSAGLHMPPPRSESSTGWWYLTHVTDGDTWTSLAMLDGRTNPWDLIKANFRTTDAKEVNWYMQEYMGCSLETADKNNYRFTKADNPGIIYTQNIIYRKGAPPAVTLYKFVQSALGHPKIGLVNFQMFGGHLISPSLFHHVRGCVNRGWIRIIYEPGLPSDGKYIPTENVLRLKSASQDDVNASLIVHECVHAGLDFHTLRTRNFNKARSEALAYLAQCIYYHRRTLSYLGGGDEASIFDAANEIVIDMEDREIKGYRLPSDLYTVPKKLQDALFNAVTTSSRYSGAADETTYYDGIDDPRWA